MRTYNFILILNRKKVTEYCIVGHAFLEKVSAAKSVMLDISLLSAHDGKDDVCEAAASIARDVRSGHIRDIDTDIDVDLVGSRLKTNLGMPGLATTQLNFSLLF